MNMSRELLGELLNRLRGVRLTCPRCGAGLSGEELQIRLQGLCVRCGICGGIHDAMNLLEEPVEVELEFEPLAEAWSTYRLSDGTKLKIRPILLHAYLLLQPGGPALKLTFDRVSTVAAPQHLRGTPSKTPHSPDSLKKMRREAVEVIERTEPWSSYLLQTGDSIKARLQVVQVRRIEAYDERGNPYYELVTELTVEPSMKIPNTL